MENLSFISYLKSKERKFLKYKNKLEKRLIQLGGSDGSPIELKTIQIELLKIKKKLAAIKQTDSKSIIDPYKKLKPFIDSINIKINEIDAKIDSQSINAKESDIIINQINDINILLENTGSNYTSVHTDKNIKFMKEKIEPKMVSDIFDKYIGDTSKLVSELKLQMNGGKDGNISLIDNEDIYNNIKAIEKKILDSFSDYLTHTLSHYYARYKFKKLYKIKLIVDYFAETTCKLFNKIFIYIFLKKNIKEYKVFQNEIKKIINFLRINY